MNLYGIKYLSSGLYGSVYISSYYNDKSGSYENCIVKINDQSSDTLSEINVTRRILSKFTLDYIGIYDIDEITIFENNTDNNNNSVPLTDKYIDNDEKPIDNNTDSIVMIIPDKGKSLEKIAEANEKTDDINQYFETNDKGDIDDYESSNYKNFDDYQERNTNLITNNAGSEEYDNIMKHIPEILLQLLFILDWFRHQQIIHRDLNFSNILIQYLNSDELEDELFKDFPSKVTNKFYNISTEDYNESSRKPSDNFPMVSVIDFGDSTCCLGNNKCCVDYYCPESFRPPEVFVKNTYDFSLDYFMVGIMMCILINNSDPLTINEDDKDKRISKVDHFSRILKFLSDENHLWRDIKNKCDELFQEDVSKAVYNIIRKLLSLNPSERFVEPSELNTNYLSDTYQIISKYWNYKKNTNLTLYSNEIFDKNVETSFVDKNYLKSVLYDIDKKLDGILSITPYIYSQTFVMLYNYLIPRYYACNDANYIFKEIKLRFVYLLYISFESNIEIKYKDDYMLKNIFEFCKYFDVLDINHESDENSSKNYSNSEYERDLRKRVEEDYRNFRISFLKYNYTDSPRSYFGRYVTSIYDLGKIEPAIFDKKIVFQYYLS